MNLPDPKASNFLNAMFIESDSYSSMEMIESCVESGVSLHNIPLQPLYLALKTLPSEQVAQYLPKLSAEQRSLMQDLDLWKKDDLDTDEFEFWIQSYARCMDDDIRSEFAKGIDFLLYLKGRFNIWTFDVEDPEYPDHDNYFLTDDSLLLFEFHEDFPYVDFVRALIRELYSEMGVENAYTWLFKMISDEAYSMLEDEYQAKKSRLADAGFVDYFDALSIDNPFINMSFLENFLRKKTSVSVGVDNFSKQQILPKSALIAFKSCASLFDEQLSKVKDNKRKSYLQFNFLRLVNANISLRGDFKDGSISINRAGEKTKSSLLLAFDYLMNDARSSDLFDIGDDSLFEHLDFTQIFKIGNSLYRFGQKDLKEALKKCQTGFEEPFLGQLINEFLDHSFKPVPHYSNDFSTQAKIIDNYKDYQLWMKDCQLIVQMIPFISGLYSNFSPLKNDGQIQDHFYFNYNVDEIDVEAIMLSSFANHCLVTQGLLKESQLDSGKLGLKVEEFRDFATLVLSKEGELVDVDKFIQSFQEKFGLSEISAFKYYLKTLLTNQVVGYDYKNLSDADFAHVGGPIIFTPQENLS